MGFFSFLSSPDINSGVKEFNNTKGAVLLDVRTESEYKEGHIPKSKNLPLDKIGGIINVIENKETPIFVHCLSGGRSSKAASALKSLGYENVKNIGGISSYSGEIVR